MKLLANIAGIFIYLFFLKKRKNKTCNCFGYILFDININFLKYRQKYKIHDSSTTNMIKHIKAQHLNKIELNTVSSKIDIPALVSR